MSEQEETQEGRPILRKRGSVRRPGLRASIRRTSSIFMRSMRSVLPASWRKTTAEEAPQDEGAASSVPPVTAEVEGVTSAIPPVTPGVDGAVSAIPLVTPEVEGAASSISPITFKRSVTRTFAKLFSSSKAHGATYGHSSRSPNRLTSRRSRRQTASSVFAERLKFEVEDVQAQMDSMDLNEDGKDNASRRKVLTGKKKFNMDPKKGIEYMIEEGLLDRTAECVAEFLFQGDILNKAAIGEYLGEKEDFNLEVLGAFVKLHEFGDMILVQALRQFLWSFRLPGEAQKIDRMMECFAKRYCELNPETFSNSDTCYVLSFSIIMLQTSLHNPSVKDKPDVERFIKMNRGINDGGDIPRDLLVSLYESVKKEPFKLPNDDGNDLMSTFFDPDKEGWLSKQGGRIKNWKRRWFILSENCLYYFEYTADKEPRGIIPLESLCVRPYEERNRQFCFELFSDNSEIIKACKTDKEGKVVEGKHTVYKMAAADEADRDAWVKSIRASISDNPVYHILKARKLKAKQGD